MGVLQDHIEAMLREHSEGVPRLVMPVIVRRKFAQLGLENPAMEAALVEHMLGDGVEDFEWEDDDPSSQVLISFDESDFDAVLEDVEALGEGFGDFLKPLVEGRSDQLVASYRAQWAERRSAADEDFATFRANLQTRWGAGLDGLRLLLDLARDHGSRLFDERQKNSSDLVDALCRLHMRGCQTAAEIITLLENGYADGARVRWRTMLELCVVASVLREGGEAMAERYLDHEAVDRKREMAAYEKAAAMRGEPDLGESDKLAINDAYEAALRRHGNEFREPYGWAAHQSGFNANPKFSHLEEAAGMVSRRLHYKLASYGVHAGPSAFTRQLGSLQHGRQIAGASNAGIEEPGANTSHALVLLTGLLVAHPWSLDDQAELSAMIHIRDEADRAFHDAADKLERDDRRVQREQLRAERAARRPVKRKPVRW